MTRARRTKDIGKLFYMIDEDGERLGLIWAMEYINPDLDDLIGYGIVVTRYRRGTPAPGRNCEIHHQDLSLTSPEEWK